jgi:hypothetical protein
MKAQIIGEVEVYDFIVRFDNSEEGNRIWLPDEELVDLTEEQVALVLQYRKLASKYYELCKAKKAEQDAKESG